MCSVNHYVCSKRVPESSQGWVIPHKWSDLIKVCSLNCELPSMLCSVVSATF